MKKTFTILSALLTLYFIYPSFTLSQWSNNSNVNLQVCGAPGEQVLPKMGNTSDGQTYICWFDSRNGSYAVYLQRLNLQGIKQMGPDSNGLLISSNPQSSSLVDYDMIVDDSDNAIIAFTDTRNGSEINPFIYKISRNGNFLWGANGISLANDAGTFQANPRLSKTTDNSIVVTWIYSSSPNKIAFQKISPVGSKLWGSDPIYLSGTGTENFTYTSLVESDNGSVIALWSGYTGSFINPGNYKLYTQKFSASGTMVWKDTVYNLGRVTGFFVPKIFSDENNGALYVWQDDRNSVNLQSSYVQHYSSSGVRIFPLNGSEASTEAGFDKFDAWATYMPSTNETYLVWKESNDLQSLFAVYGQRFNSVGARLWTDNAKQFVPYSSDSYVNQICFTYDTNVVVAFNQALFGSNNYLQKAFKTGRNGILGWTGTIINVSSILSEKSKIEGTIFQGMTKLVWSDNRNGAADIYAQNINPNGTLGNEGVYVYENNSPVSFSLSQNYPNPFNPVTNLEFGISDLGFVSLKVFNALGKEVQTLVNEKLQPGSYKVVFNGSNLSSGIYFYRIETGSFTDTKKMLLVK